MIATLLSKQRCASGSGVGRHHVPEATEYVGFLEEVKAISWPPRGAAQTHQETLAADQKCRGWWA